MSRTAAFSLSEPSAVPAWKRFGRRREEPALREPQVVRVTASGSADAMNDRSAPYEPLVAANLALSVKTRRSVTPPEAGLMLLIV